MGPWMPTLQGSTVPVLLRDSCGPDGTVAKEAYLFTPAEVVVFLCPS